MGTAHELWLTGELVSTIWLSSEAAPLGPVLVWFPPSLWLEELVKVYAKNNERKTMLEWGGEARQGRTEVGLGWDAAAILTSKPGWACPEE